MAKRGTKKRKSQDQEEFLALLYGGTVSPSSGAADNDSGDVRTDLELIEAKVTGEPGDPKKSISVKVEDFEKITQEAYAEGKEPVLALRIYNPDSTLASPSGWIDLAVRSADDDSFRSDVVRRFHGA